MSAWGRSRELTRTSYEVVKKRPELRGFTVRAAVHGALIGGTGVLLGAAVAMGGSAILDPSNGSEGSAIGVVLVVLGVLLVALGSLAGLVAANLQLAALVRATDDVLHGRDPDVAKAREAAHARFGALAGWSAISVAVGGLVSVISGDGDGGFVTSIVRSLLAGLVAGIWAIVTTLAMPLIVLEDLSAVASIKRSAHLIRSTWGEAALGGVRIGARFALAFTLPGTLLTIGGIVLVVFVDGSVALLGIPAAMLGAVLVVIGAVRAVTCRNVFGVALYRWATGEGALGPFSDEDLRGAVELAEAASPLPA